MPFYRRLKYSLGFTIPLAAFLSVYLGGIWSWLTPVYGFLVVPLAELLLPQNTGNLNSAEEELAKNDRWYDRVLYLNVPVQYAVLIYFLYTVSHRVLSNLELAGMIVSMGICCGVIGINVAHELGHRKNRTEQFMAKALLLTSLYMHFIIEHNKGHHKRVSTEEDPSSARYNEPIYFFYPRTIFGSLRSAWKIQSDELHAAQKNVISIHNALLIFFIIELITVTAVLIVFGGLAMLAFLSAALIGILLLESVNYIEHYGLRRQKTGAAQYERVQPWHSWNSDFVLGRLVLYELTRHSDHHYLASRKYQILRHMEEAPQLPAGYPAMIILSLIPPVFFGIMNPRIKKIQQLHSKTPL